MENKQDIVLCSGYMDICNEQLELQTTRTYPLKDKDIRRAMVKYDPISHTSSIWRREALLKTTLYSKNFPICRDYDLIVRISEFGKYANIPKPLIVRRKAAAESKKAELENAEQTARIVMKSIAEPIRKELKHVRSERSRAGPRSSSSGR